MEDLKTGSLCKPPKLCYPYSYFNVEALTRREYEHMPRKVINLVPNTVLMSPQGELLTRSRPSVMLGGRCRLCTSRTKILRAVSRETHQALGPWCNVKGGDGFPTSPRSSGAGMLPAEETEAQAPKL